MAGNTVRVGTQVTGVGKASSDLDRLRDRFDKLQKQGAKGFAIGAGAAATTAGLNLVGNALAGVGDMFAQNNQAASDLSESMSKSKVIFGDSADEIEAFGDTSARAMGLSKRATVEAAATFGNLFVGLDLGEKKAAEMSKGIVTLAGDLASFNNLRPEDVLEKLRAGLAGEAEPLRSVGVFLNEAKVKAKAMEMGLGKAHGELTDGEKILARYKLIMEETTTAQGDFARTADGVANSTRTANAELEDLRAQLGGATTGADLLATKLQVNLFRGIGRVAERTGEMADEFRRGTEILTPWDEEAERAAKEADRLARAMSDLGHFAGKATDDIATGTDDATTALDDFATRSEKNSTRVVKSLGGIADAFDETWSELSGAADQAAEDIFGPIERRAELNANRLAQSAALGEINKPRQKGESALDFEQRIAGARAELLGLQKDFFTLMVEMEGRGELSAGEISKVNAALKEELKTASLEEQTSILNLITLLDRLRAKSKGIFTAGNINVRSSGSGQAGQGGRASGGPVVGNRPVVVGEKGPEVFVPQGAGTVLPNAGSGRAVGGMGTDPAILAALNQQTAYLARIAAGEPHAARPMTARGDLARQSALMPGGRL